MFDLEGKLLAYAKKNGFKIEDSDLSDGITLRDVLNKEDLSRLVPLAISEIVREAAEPHLLANELFVNINQKEGIYIQLPAVGAMDSVEEVAPGQEYGTEEITLGGGSTIRIDMRKYGVKLALTEEMVEQSQWDVIGEWLKAAGKAFARKKNRICFNLFEAQGLTLVDNVNPGKSVLGRPLSGKDINGTDNGTFTAEDFFDIYAAMLQEGFAPSIIVLHPLTWAIWVKDPMLRAWALQNGGGPLMNGYDLSGVQRKGFWGGAGMSSGGARPGEEMPADFKAKPILPSYLNVPFTVMVSPFVPFDPVQKLASMYFIDPENAGAIVQGENINHHQWSDPERDIHLIKLREKYALAMLNEGRGVGVVKNVPVKPNRFADFGVTSGDIVAAGGTITMPEDMNASSTVDLT
jgi:hypothetical protein